MRLEVVRRRQQRELEQMAKFEAQRQVEQKYLLACLSLCAHSSLKCRLTVYACRLLCAWLKVLVPGSWECVIDAFDRTRSSKDKSFLLSVQQMVSDNQARAEAERKAEEQKVHSTVFPL